MSDKIFVLLFFGVASFSSSGAQDLLKIDSGCQYFAGTLENTYYQFNPSNEFLQIIEDILEKVGIRSKETYVVKESNVSNALATYQNGRRYILYNPVFLETIKSESNNKWAAFSVLAHEIGHHVNNHSFSEVSVSQRKIFELEADIFSGEALRAFNATLDDALIGVNQLPDSVFNTSGYPSRLARSVAITNGWKRRDEQEADSLYQNKIMTMISGIERNMILIKDGVYLLNNQGSVDGVVQVPAFSISKYEVTQHEWTTIMGRNPAYFQGCPNCPVENISWNDAQLFIKRLNQISGRTYRLPTSVEWEYAFLAGGDTTLFNLRALDSVLLSNGYFYEDNVGKPQPVGTLKPNKIGLYDMLGNVAEWCQDWSQSKKSLALGEFVSQQQGGYYKTIRGGSWLDSRAMSETAFKARHLPNIYMPKYGLRLCHSVP